MSRGGRQSKIRRLQELLVEGRVITFKDAGEPLTLWVAKPNSFERDEATLDARGARARRVLAFDANDAEQAVLEERLTQTDKASRIRSVLQSKENEFYVKAMDDIRTRKEWAERLEAIARGRELLEDQPATDDDERSRQAEEREVLRQINADYFDEVQKYMDRLVVEETAEMESRTDDEVEQEYRKIWREGVGTQSYLAERRISELYFAVRDCQGTPDEAKPDGYDHSGCNSHLTRLAEHRHEVHEFPDLLIEEARKALDEMAMSPQDAAFSDAPTSSSASSERPSEAAESAPSTPVETSLEPVGT